MGPATLPDLEEVLARLHVVGIPLRTRFRRTTVREVALLEGPTGWGEFGPFPEYGPQEASRWLGATIDAAWGSPAPSLRAEVPVNATVPAVAAADVLPVLARFDGCTTAKVKVAEPGQRLRDDVERVAAVRRHLGRDARIRVDANGGWSLAQARDAVAALAPFDLEYVEQPCADVEDLARLRVALAGAGLDVRVAADESIRRAEDPLRVARLEAADVVVVKVAPLGGVARALQVVADCGLPAVVSSALDTSIGIAAGVRLAAALPDLPFACGLGTVELFTGDVVADSLVAHDGVIDVARAVGVAATPDLLDRWRVDPERERWWRERTTAAHGVLTAGTA